MLFTKKIQNHLLLLCGSLILTACAGIQPNQAEINSAYYGEPVSQELFTANVENLMSRVLIDPSSATYECMEPAKGWAAQYFDNLIFGYLGICEINAKNRFGGYTGRKRMVFMIAQQKGKSVILRLDDGDYESRKEWHYALVK